MRTPEIFLLETKRLSGIADDPVSTLGEKLRALCALYFWYQGDVHMQARTVRKIEDIARTI
jgi:hypothetical protein